MRILALLTLLIATPATAADLRDLCPDRPGNATPPCIVDAGHLQTETALTDWTHDRRAGVATDAFNFAATEIRVGLTSSLEAEVSFAPFNTLTVRDHNLGTRDHAQGFGDVSFGFRQSLLNPDGKHVSAAIQPFLTMPTGKDGIGNNGWSGGVLLPFAAELGGGFGLGATPEIDWSVNGADTGRHATYTGVVSLSHALGVTQAGVELWASRDDDPAGRTTQATADFTLAWTPKSAPNLQFDAAVNARLNRDTPRLEVYVGVARRF